MKTNLHQFISVAALLLAVNMPLATKAQCLCEDGVAPTAVKHTFVLDTTSASSSYITFPKLDPAIGTLICTSFADTLSLITTSDVVNTAIEEVTYIFNLRVVNHFAGPGISVFEVEERTYGPTVLAAAGQPGSQTRYGPDTIFTNNSHLTNTTNVSGYLGTGDTAFRYTVNGGLTADLGGLNYSYTIASKYWGKFGLTYYWCPNSVLASNIKNFAAVKNNKNVDLTWIVNNNLTSSTYEIQVSTNGREFTRIGNAETSVASSGLNAKYAYQYNPNQVVTGQLFFRIRQTDATGKVSYSPVKAINMDTPAANAFTSFPNPAVDKVSLQFDSLLTGDYTVDITNQAGQRILSRGMKLKNASLINLNLGSNRASGVYYVRVKNTSNGQVFTNKILINK